MKNKLKILLVLFGTVILQGCVASNYHTSYMSKTMYRFSIPKRRGMGRHLIHNRKKRLSPTYTKAARDME